MADADHWMRILYGFGAFVLAASPILAMVILSRWQKSRLDRYSDLGPTCDRCGYLLIGLNDSRCPECGTTIARETIEELKRSISTRPAEDPGRDA